MAQQLVAFAAVLVLQTCRAAIAGALVDADIVLEEL